MERLQTVCRAQFKRPIQSKDIVRVIETHSSISSSITENLEVDVKGQKRSFDAVWSSAFTDRTNKGKPDIEVVDTSDRANTISSIFAVTTKPMIYDGDTGGKPEHFAFTVRGIPFSAPSGMNLRSPFQIATSSVRRTRKSSPRNSRALLWVPVSVSGWAAIILTRMS